MSALRVLAVKLAGEIVVIEAIRRIRLLCSHISSKIGVTENKLRSVGTMERSL